MIKLENGRRMRIITSGLTLMVIIISLLYLTIYYDEDEGTTNDDLGIIDYQSLYENSSLGGNWAYGIDLPLSPPINIEIPQKATTLPIYGYIPLNMDNIEDVKDYITGLNYDIENHTIELVPSFPPEISQIGFRNKTEWICVYKHRNYHIEYNISSLPNLTNLISEDEAIEIATKYLENHSGVPMDIFTREVDTNKDSCWVRYIQSADDIPIRHTARQNQILIGIDRHKGAIFTIHHHWPDITVIGYIDTNDIGDPEDLVSEFISGHNDAFKQSSLMANITNISYYYSATIGYFYKDGIEGSPFYIYLPYLKIEWETGVTMIQPTKET